MSDNLLGGLTSLITPALMRGMAGSLGDSEDAVSKGMSAVMPILLGGVAERSSDAGFMSQLFGLVTDPANDGSLLDKPDTLLGSAAAALPIVALGGKLLDLLFGNNMGKLAGNVGNHAGMKASSAASMFKFAAPLVLGMLGKMVKKDKLDSGGLGQLLGREKDIYKAAIPGPLGALDGYFAAPASERREAFTPPPPPPPPKKSIWRWLGPLLIALAVLWLLSKCMGGEDEPAMSKSPAPPPTPAPAASAPAPAAAPPTATLFFELDESALAVDAGPMLDPIVAYLKANPGSKAYVTGYHDPSGDLAHNEELAKERAAAVQQYLMTNGVGLRSIEMAKPVVTTGSGTAEEARRVEVAVVP